MPGPVDRFAGKVVLISGGGRGMGAVEAGMLVAEGAQVVVGDVRPEEGEALARTLGPRCRYLAMDVTEAGDWDRAVALCLGLGGLHGLVNNAGVYTPEPLRDTGAASWDRHLAVNQTGVFLGLKAAAEPMIAAGSGAIVNLSSIAGLRGVADAFAYTATKWAVRGMTKCAARELGPHGVRVNSVHPGLIDTEMLRVRTPAQLAERTKQVPQARLGTAEEVARTVLFLLSDEAAYVNGAEVTVDGGITA